jgi:hypothetical protein
MGGAAPPHEPVGATLDYQPGHSPETRYQEGGKQGGLDLVARSVGNLGSMRKQGSHDMAHGLLDQGGGWWMALWELGPAGATAAAGDAGLGAASSA